MRIRNSILFAAALCIGCATTAADTAEPVAEPEPPPSPESLAPSEKAEQSLAPQVAALDQYVSLPKKERVAKAKELLADAKVLGESGSWTKAGVKYEQVYYMFPEKHKLALKVGRAAYNAGDCPKADEYLNHFMQNSSKKEHKKERVEAKKLLAKTKECPTATEGPIDPGEPNPDINEIL